MTAKTVEVKSDTPLDAAPALPARAQTAPLDAAAEQAAEAVLEAAVSAQPRSFHRRVSGKFTMRLG